MDRNQSIKIHLRAPHLSRRTVAETQCCNVRSDVQLCGKSANVSKVLNHMNYTVSTNHMHTVYINWILLEPTSTYHDQS